jgi:hypothetical protein
MEFNMTHKSKFKKVAKKVKEIWGIIRSDHQILVIGTNKEKVLAAIPKGPDAKISFLFNHKDEGRWITTTIKRLDPYSNFEISPGYHYTIDKTLLPIINGNKTLMVLAADERIKIAA